MKNTIITIIISTLTACQKPQIAIIPPALHSQPQPLTISGYYNHQTCTLFYDARISPTGDLRQDDTTEPEACSQHPSYTGAPVQLQTFRFPLVRQADLYGIRFTLQQRLLRSSYRFRPDGLQLATPAYPDFQNRAMHTFAFAAPGKQVLQVFFRESDWQHLLASADKLLFSFQLEKLPSASDGVPTFSLLQGHFALEDGVLQLDHTSDWNIASPELQFQLIDSLHTLRIRSIYHLLTEDFALWNGNQDCQSLQNWDLSLIPAIGYNLLEVKIDPPFLECLRVGEEGFNFQVAWLQ